MFALEHGCKEAVIISLCVHVLWSAITRGCGHVLCVQVENYVEHIRNLLEERESLTAEYERENDQLRAELSQMKHQLGELGWRDENP